METKEAKQKEKNTLGREIFEWAKAIVIALVAALLIRTFVFGLVRVDGASMLETLQHGDIMFVTMYDRFFGDYERGEVVICNYPNAKGYRVKRVVGLPGDTIEIKDKQTYINGELLEEDYVEHLPRTAFGPYTVQEGEYFLLGDNRTVSKDSRSSDVGPIAEKEICGVVRAVIFPFNAIRTVK
ncbi:MAG: signal peptidase I [Clostridia bacterium]|nr:signal peptidase I [Clostridia bacterium]MBQ4085766.1 signal peptidase I [Clostridia bacterium]